MQIVQTTTPQIISQGSAEILECLMRCTQMENGQAVATQFITNGLESKRYTGDDVFAASAIFNKYLEKQRAEAPSRPQLEAGTQTQIDYKPASATREQSARPLELPLEERAPVPLEPPITVPTTTVQVPQTDEKKLKIDALADLILNVCKEFSVNVSYKGGSSKGARHYQLRFSTGYGVRGTQFSNLRSEFISKGVDENTGLMIPEVGVTIRERSGYMELMIPKDTWEVCPIERYIKAVKRSPAETIKGVVGIDLDGKVPVLDIDGVLISGIRRGGKSTAMRTLLTSLMKWYHPNHLKVLLIDTDGLNLPKFKDAPHLYAEVITTSEEALDALHYLLNVEMKQRRETFSRYPDLDDICEYNQMFPNNPIPWIAVAIEELAMLSDLTEKQVYKDLEPLLGQSGKYGIVFILGTQRPDKDVISQIVKANLDLRIALKVSSPENSKIALDVEKGTLTRAS